MSVYYAGHHEGHSHPDTDRLTFGCDGCVLRADRERWERAPLRRTHWTCVVPNCFAEEGDDGELVVKFTLDARVPDGTTPDELELRLDWGEAFVMALPDSVPMDATTEALEFAEMRSVRVEDIPAEKAPQPSLFGAAS